MTIHGILILTGVGFIVEFDSIKVYHAGGSTKIPEMADLASQNITYTLLSMIEGADSMTQAAAMIQAKHDIPMHTDDTRLIVQFTSPHRLILLQNETINLTADTTLCTPQRYSAFLKNSPQFRRQSIQHKTPILS